MAVYLIRHGETPGNAARVFQVPETPLSERGVGQAAQLAERLRDAGIRHILASDFERAHHTARSLAETTGAPIQLEPLLQERNFGELRGTPYADLEGDPFHADFVPPAGESWGDFYVRVEAAWRRVGELADRLDGHLAVVTHGLVCHAMASRHVASDGVPAADGPLHFGNTALTILQGPAPWRVELFACTAHLDDAPVGAPV